MLQCGMVAGLIDAPGKLLIPLGYFIRGDNPLPGIAGLGSSDKIFEGVSEGIFKPDNRLRRDETIHFYLPYYAQ